MSKSARILIADDFQTMRRIIRTLFKELGYTNIQEAENGRKALQLLGQSEFDLVVTDWNMPEFSGLELLQAIRNDERLSSLPVLMVTAESKRDQIIAAAQAGVNGYIVKPFNAKQLKERVEKLIH